MEFDRSLDVPEPVAYVVAWFLIVLIHELGHLLTAVLLGIKNNLFSVGPFRVRVLNGRYHFDCSFKHFNALGGLVAP